MENKYTKEEVHTATLEYFDGDELATNVWTSKYALRDLNDNYYEKTPVSYTHLTLPTTLQV